MKGYRTLIFNLLAAILPIMEASGADLGLTGNAQQAYALFIVVGNVILRTYTTTPIAKKD